MASVIPGDGFGRERWPTTSAAGAGSLWRLSTISAAVCQWQSSRFPTALAWSQDRGTLYLIDSPTLQVMAFPLTSTSGDLAGESHPVHHHSRGLGCPSGWHVHRCGGHALDRPVWWWVRDALGSISGQLLERLELPCRQVTSCCFGGPIWISCLMTTARQEMDAAAIKAEPLAGGLFQADVGVKGLPAELFSSGGINIVLS